MKKIGHVGMKNSVFTVFLLKSLALPKSGILDTSPINSDSKWDSSGLHRFNQVRNAQKAQKMNKIALEGRGICHLEAVFEGTKTRHTRRAINEAMTFGDVVEGKWVVNVKSRAKYLPS